MKQSLLIFYIGIVSLVNNIFMLPFILFSMLISDKLKIQWWNSFLISISGILKYIYNISIFIDDPELLYTLVDDKYDRSHSVLIQNHLTQIDTIFTLPILSTKESIPQLTSRAVVFIYTHFALPGFGMMCYLFNNIMISFNKEKNNADLAACKLDSKDLLILYPEGCLFAKDNKMKADKYCEDNNIEKMKNCIYPRAGAMNIIHENNRIDEIFSTCIQYDNIKPDEKYKTILNIDLPKKVFINIKKHTNFDNIAEKTVSIFRENDKIMDQEIDESKYTLLKPKYIELLCMLFHTFIFIGSCYLLTTSSIAIAYFITMILFYYIYFYINMETI